MFKTRLDNLGTILGVFGILKNILKTFRRLDPPWNTGQKKFLEKFTPKHVQNKFWHFWERFWAFLEFCKISDFLKPFRRLDPPWNTTQKEISDFSKKYPKTRQKKFRKNYPKTCSKHFWTIWERLWAFRQKKIGILTFFGNNFGHLRNFENFLIY